tara:strand:+ start:361 stop:597 length:237 start_codon:yes stop_codon:yes gene_type:complete
MTTYGKGVFGKGVEINAQVVNGKCPFCHTSSVLVSIYKTVFRCITCGSDVEQKVNGKIAYIPLGGNIVMTESKDPNNG